MDENVTFAVTITGTYTVPRSKLQEFYSTDDEGFAAQIDTDHFNDFPGEGFDAIETPTIHVEVEVAGEDA